MARILKRGEHRGPGTYEEADKPLEVGRVIMCPQPRGLPIFAVLAPLGGGLLADKTRWGEGHLITVASDGVIVRCWIGNNFANGLIEDVNADGIVERVETMNYMVGEQVTSTVRELFVLPITEEVTPTLRIAFDVDAPDKPTAWRVVPAKEGQPARIQIGPKDPETGELQSVAAEWQWLAKHSAWVGPGGGPDQSFVRLPPVGTAGLDEFAAAQRKKAERDR